MASKDASNGKAVWTKPITLKRAKLDVMRAATSSTHTISQGSSDVTTKSPYKHIFIGGNKYITFSELQGQFKAKK